MRTYTNDFKTFYFEECDNGYVSPYSIFMLEQYPLNIVPAASICDLGAGTGILGLVASTLKPRNITMIENNDDCFNVMQRNIVSNQIPPEIEINCHKSVDDCSGEFDSIICNPASLPNFINANSFCDGGILGIDMIMLAVDFANERLSASGKMYIIITGVLPRQPIEEKIYSLGLQYKIVAKKVIPFRSHYAGIKEWVDKLKSQYNEMYYIIRDGQVYEELLLWEIKRGNCL